MARGVDGKFIRKAQAGEGKSALRISGSPVATLRKKELRESRRARRKALKAIVQA